MLPSLQSANSAIEANNIDEALIALQEYLNNCYSPSQIDDGVRFILAKKNQFSNKDLTQIFKTIQLAVSEKVLSQGETPDAFYNFLYDIAPALEQNQLITETITALKDFYKEIDSSSTEALVVRNLLFTLNILNGNKENGFDEYFKTTLITKLDQMEILPDGTGQFMGLLQNFNLPFERIAQIYKTIFAPETFFLLGTTEQRSVFAWSFHCVWNVPCYFNNLKWIDLYDNWKTILYKYLENEQIAEAMYLHFYIHHKMGNSAQGADTWIKFNEEIEYPCAVAYQKFSKSQNLPKCKSEVSSEGKIKIALLMERVVMNSPFKVTLGLLSELIADKQFSEKYEICIYSMNYFEKSQDSHEAITALKEIGVVLFSPAYMLFSSHYYINHLQKAVVIRNAIIKDNIDILIACTNNFAIESFLLGLRTAPKQIYWCHGNFAYDVPNIDKRITHIALNSEQNKSNYEFCKFEAVQLDEHLKGKASEAEYKNAANKIRKRFNDDTVILGSVGRLVKIDNDEYLSALAEILKECPNGVYLACGVGNVSEIKERARRLDVPLDRFYFEGHVDPHIYGYAIDVYLNTFPEPSGEALNEFLTLNPIAISKVKQVRAFDSQNIENLDARVKRYIEFFSKFSKKTILEYLQEYNALQISVFDSVFSSLQQEKKTVVEKYFSLVSDMQNASFEDLIKEMVIRTDEIYFIYELANLIDKVALNPYDFSYKEQAEYYIKNKKLVKYLQQATYLQNKYFNQFKYYVNNDYAIFIKLLED